MTIKKQLYDKEGNEVLPVTSSECVVTSIVNAQGTTLNAQTGKYYRFDDEVNTLEIILPNEEAGSVAKALSIFFTTGYTPQVTINAGDTDVRYFSGFAIEPNTTYELNIMWNGAKWIVAYGVVE